MKGFDFRGIGMVRLSLSKVPIELRVAAPLVEKWGIPDEAERFALVKGASDEELDEFIAVYNSLDESILNKWLEQPNPGVSYSDEQVAFLYFTLTLNIVEFEINTRRKKYSNNARKKDR